MTPVHYHWVSALSSKSSSSKILLLLYFFILHHYWRIRRPGYTIAAGYWLPLQRHSIWLLFVDFALPSAASQSEVFPSPFSNPNVSSGCLLWANVLLPHVVGSPFIPSAAHKESWLVLVVLTTIGLFHLSSWLSWGCVIFFFANDDVQLPPSF